MRFVKHLLYAILHFCAPWKQTCHKKSPLQQVKQGFIKREVRTACTTYSDDSLDHSHIFFTYMKTILSTRGFSPRKYKCLQHANFLRRLFGVSNLLWCHRLVEGIINSNKFVVEICVHTCGIALAQNLRVTGKPEKRSYA